MAQPPVSIPVKHLRNGFALPVFGLGTWQMGGRTERDTANDDAADIQAIRAAIDIGITHIDTAEVYANGHTEEIVAEAIKDYDRSQLLLVSKVHAEHLAYDDIQRACEASLRRLGTDYLDLYLAHRYNPNIPLKETIKGLNRLVDQGLVRSIGVSNFNQQHLKEAQALSNHPIVCDQVHYSLKFRQPELDGLLKYCQTEDVLLVAWRPVQKGVFGKRGIPILDEMCEHYQRTPAQVTLNWLISQPNVVTISKMRQAEHLKDNLGAIGWQMETEDIERLRRDFPEQEAVSDSIPLG
ncbi:MAG: aldo/keto reductase [Candidatus Veblenbacteria bacterium]|nr:aldo/keto reductase [Candidatus Veblenbacteria bacterium]